MRDFEGIAGILRCTRCGSAGLQVGDDSICCPGCGARFPVVQGVPVMWPVPGEVRLVDESHRSNQLPAALLDWMESLDGWCLNLGAGATGRQLRNCIEAEYAVFVNTDVVVDAHCLPFPDDFFEAVVSFNTFEHLARPAVAAEEVRRVLKPRGRLVLETAFLQPLHEAPYHFYNATEFGVRNWFPGLTIERCDVPNNFSPAMTLAWLSMEFLHYVGLSLGWDVSNELANTTLAQWRTMWVDPERRCGPLWDAVEALPPDVRSRFSAGFHLEATKPTSP